MGLCDTLCDQAAVERHHATHHRCQLNAVFKQKEAMGVKSGHVALNPEGRRLFPELFLYHVVGDRGTLSVTDLLPTQDCTTVSDLLLSGNVALHHRFNIATRVSIPFFKINLYLQMMKIADCFFTSQLYK